MTLLEEKKMVLKWLRKVIDLRWYWPKGYNKAASKKRIEFWNPQSNDCPYSDWSEIWGNMDEDTFAKYLTTVVSLMGFDENSTEIFKIARFAHTAKPAICWQALIKTIEES